MPVENAASYLAPLLDAVHDLAGDWRARGAAAAARFRSAAGRTSAPVPAPDFGHLMKAIEASSADFAADAKETLDAARKREFAEKFAHANEMLREAIAAGRVSGVNAAKAEAAMSRLADAAGL
jgi:hypothetical protein